MSKPEDSNPNHREILELIPLYVSGALNADEKQKLESQLSTSEEYRSQLEFEQSLQQSVAEFDDAEINSAMERNFSQFSERLKLDQEENSVEAQKTSAPVKQNTSDISAKISGFFKSLLPSSNPQLGGAFAMGLAAVIGIGIFIQSPSEGLNQPSNWSSEEFVRSCESGVGAQNFEFTLTPTSANKLTSEDVAKLASSHLQEDEFNISSSAEEIVLVMNGEECDKRVPQLLQTLKSNDKLIKSVEVRNISQ